MLVPGRKPSGLLNHLSSAPSVHVISECFMASEYRANPETVPALRFQIPARLGPVRCSPGSTEWQAAQARNTAAPLAGSPAAREPALASTSDSAAKRAVDGACAMSENRKKQNMKPP